MQDEITALHRAFQKRVRHIACVRCRKERSASGIADTYKRRKESLYYRLMTCEVLQTVMVEVADDVHGSGMMKADAYLAESPVSSCVGEVSLRSVCASVRAKVTIKVAS